jgi:sugar/nucleoside kinase (ribokinase family)
VGLDTMNLWIEKAPKQLAEVLKKINIFIINDSEARQLSGKHNLVKGAKRIMGMMGKNATLIIKQGEYGLLMFRSSPSFQKRGLGGVEIFHLPGFPLEDVTDPTGAGDSFAGGMFGYLAKTNNISWENLKRACVAGSVLASFSVEKLGTKRLQEIKTGDVAKRFSEFKKLTRFE